jgi:hypothetical protein
VNAVGQRDGASVCIAKLLVTVGSRFWCFTTEKQNQKECVSMSLTRLALIFASLTAADRIRAGEFTVAGHMNVTSNLTAQSIMLGGQTSSNWPSGGGYKYVVVAEGTNDTQGQQPKGCLLYGDHAQPGRY